MGEDNKGVLETDHNSQYHPCDHKELEEGRARVEDVTQVTCLASLEAAKDEDQAAEGTKEGVKDRVLDEGTDANILSLYVKKLHIFIT